MNIEVGFLLGAGLKSHYVTLTSYCLSDIAVSTDVGQGQEGKTHVFVTFKEGEKRKE